MGRMPPLLPVLRAACRATCINELILSPIDQTELARLSLRTYKAKYANAATGFGLTRELTQKHLKVHISHNVDFTDFLESIRFFKLGSSVSDSSTKN